MQTNLEQVTGLIRGLPLEDLDKLRQAIDEERRSKMVLIAPPNAQMERYKKARKWLDEHSPEYVNQWVCLEGDKLIAHSEDGKGLDEIARAAGIETPFLHHIVEEKYPFGGW